MHVVTLCSRLHEVLFCILIFLQLNVSTVSCRNKKKLDRGGKAALTDITWDRHSRHTQSTDG
jgi:hypothetical protein